MPRLTPEGEKIIAALASQYSISVASVKLMLDAVARGGGTMAQFNVPEFGGGQWMRGGMIMVGDMFNNALKATVDNLCNDLARLLASQPNLYEPVLPLQPGQQQSQGGAGVSYQSSLQSGSWWPETLGNASSTGSQNNLRYAYFPSINRLAIDDGGRIEVYDTTGYDIGGFGQQQGGSAGSLTFSSQRGIVRIEDLPRVTGRARGPAPQSAALQAPVTPQSSSSTEASPSATQPAAGGDASSVLALIQQLSQLKEKGVISEQEFSAKKTELLKRL